MWAFIVTCPRSSLIHNESLRIWGPHPVAGQGAMRPLGRAAKAPGLTGPDRGPRGGHWSGARSAKKTLGAWRAKRSGVRSGVRAARTCMWHTSWHGAVAQEKPTLRVPGRASSNHGVGKIGWGTWIRTRTNGVRVRGSTVNLFPNRWAVGACALAVSAARSTPAF